MKSLIAVFLSMSSFAMASVFVTKGEGASVARALKSDSNADLSSSSLFDSCNMHFSDY